MRDSLLREYLIVPRVKKGMGSGHIIRALRISKYLGASSSVYIQSDGEVGWSLSEVKEAYPELSKGIVFEDSMNEKENAAAENVAAIILDQKETSKKEFSYWLGKGLLVGIDEGGSLRNSFHFLIDSLQNKLGVDEANVSDRGLLDLPDNRKSELPKRIVKVLISFGGEDKLDIGPKIAYRLVQIPEAKDLAISLLRGPLAKSRIDTRLEERIELLEPKDNLKEYLHEYDLVICLYGLTAYEAAYAGCSVVVINPSEYHESLAKREGFFSAGVIDRENASNDKKVAQKIIDIIARPVELLATTAHLRNIKKNEGGIAGVVKGLDISRSLCCPNCGSRAGKATGRFKEKTYFRCDLCGLDYLLQFSKKHESYRKAYFFEDYKAQYGKTYLEDFPNLRAYARGRLGSIEKIVRKPKDGRPRVLDIGCAYGAFLTEAESRGFEPYGIDVSPEAIDYAKNTFGFKALVANASQDGFDPRSAFGVSAFQAISMWFVIEHFENLGAILDMVYESLDEGGVFAFSTPSGSGISAKTSLSSFLEKSPEDHYSVLRPRSIKRILRNRGFKVIKTRSIGHHPERFPLMKNDSGRMRKSLVLIFSRLCNLGDSFECYAVKKSRHEGT